MNIKIRYDIGQDVWAIQQNNEYDGDRYLGTINRIYKVRIERVKIDINAMQMYVSYETVRQDGNTFVHRNYVEEMLFASQFEAEHRLKELEKQ